MDPIMWDPFRYKLGGRLLNSQMKEFLSEEGRYVSARDLATYAILKEVTAGRGSPHGGAWLSFEHCSESVLREAFGPVIDRLAANGIDLSRQPIEVAPIAHYHMGGIRVDPDMRTSVPHLFAAGEAVGGANGANRLSGNAITEAVAFGRRAGERAAAVAARSPMPAPEPPQVASPRRPHLNGAAEIVRLQGLMSAHAGPLRNRAGLEKALADIMALEPVCAELAAPRGALDAEWMDMHDLRNMRLVAECITRAALAREESRGAHQREDFAETREAWQKHQMIRLADGRVQLGCEKCGLS
jgi:succinate dehydrogenase / fumarate reductase flavoprotein subunit/fumarate reductase (CoM/CoB) subunit A